MATSPFEKAHYEKIVLNKKTAKKIKRAYGTTAKEIKAQLNLLKAKPMGMLSVSESLKKVYLEGLLKDLNSSLDSLEKVVQSTILEATEQAGNLAVKASLESMEKAGLSFGIKGAYSYVPRKEMANILSGQLYGKNWTFSKAIWGAEKKTKEDLEKIVARGLAGNKPIYDIAKDLEKYVDPSARKPWDWGKVYPGTAKTVDYNAQRLARTMIQHSFQQSMVQAQLYNPFCKGIIWYSVGIHGRTCATCMERDGQVFAVKDLPLDHPNGLCYFEPALEPMDKIADRLADWTKGGSDPDLDTYVTKAFGFGAKTPEGKAAVQAAKQATVSKASKYTPKPFSPEGWINGVKKNKVSQMLAMEDKAFKNLKMAYKQALKRYTGSAYRRMNGFLRKLGVGKAKWGDGSIDASMERAIKDAQAGLRTVSTKEELFLRRGSDFSDLAGLMGGDFEANLKDLQSFFGSWRDSYSSFEDAVAYINDMVLEGTVGTFHGFTSTSSIWDRGFSGVVEYVFQAPPGTQGMSIMRISQFETEEGGFLLNAGTRVKIKKVLPSDGHFNSKVRVFLEIIV